MKRSILLSSPVFGAVSALALAFALTGDASADRIYLSNGSILEDLEVKTETLSKVVYRVSGEKKDAEVASELVLEIDYEKMPDDVASAEIDAGDEAFGAAISGMDDYLTNLGDKGDRKFKWAPAYAHFRIVELNKLGGNKDGMVAAVDALMIAAPDSRYVPLAMVEKIDTLMTLGDAAGAREAIDAFSALVKSAGMPQRWEFESSVRRVATNPTLKGEGLEKELAKIGKSAAAFPTVSNYADVAIAESMLLRGELTDAEELVRKVVADPNAPDRTLAAAWTTLGDCLFRQAEGMTAPDQKDASIAMMKESLLAYMRVVVGFRFEYAYVAKAGFYAGRCFQEIGGAGSADNSSRLFRYVRSRFRGTSWANNARDFDARNRK